jgi:hypothetical protein
MASLPEHAQGGSGAPSKVIRVSIYCFEMQNVSPEFAALLRDETTSSEG